MQSVLIIDTSALCCWLQIPGKETAGSGDNKLDYKTVDEIIQKKIIDGFSLVLPLATLLETGNHISQANSLRFECATALCELLKKSVRGNEPWAAFVEQSDLFLSDNLEKISKDWPTHAAASISIGDFLIIDVANYYADAGIKVEILTWDKGLKAYEPTEPAPAPRRRAN
jgi:hypothetical protein